MRGLDSFDTLVQSSPAQIPSTTREADSARSPRSLNAVHRQLAAAWVMSFALLMIPGSTMAAPSSAMFARERAGLTSRKLSVHLNFSSIAAGPSKTCGLLADNTALCWGQVANQQLGVDYFPSPVQGGLQFTSVSPGNTHTHVVWFSPAKRTAGAQEATACLAMAASLPPMCLPWWRI